METMKKYAVNAFKTVKGGIQYMAGMAKGFSQANNVQAYLAGIPFQDKAIVNMAVKIQYSMNFTHQKIQDKKNPPSKFEQGRRMGIAIALR